MKSMGLALTIFTLTGMLVALDLSGASGMQGSTVAVTSARSHSDAASGVASVPNNLFQEEAEGDEDEIDPGFRHAFLVTPTPATTGASPPLRYD